jgi:hypothetical protein
VKDPAESGKRAKLPPDERTRGSDAAAWQEEKLIAAGDWSALGAWAWGLSRVVDSLLKDPAVDPAKNLPVDGGDLLALIAPRPLYREEGPRSDADATRESAGDA